MWGRQITAGKLVLALGACLDAGELVVNRELDGLVVADLEMQELVVLDGAPVAAVERLGADEIDGAGDPFAGALGHHQQDAVGHGRADDREELARQIGPAPFARAGVHVEREEGVPDLLGQVGAGQPVQTDAGADGLLALAADGLAFPGIKRGEEILERGVARVLPVELLVGALEVATRAEQVPFLLGQEGHVRRGEAVRLGDLGQRVAQRAAHALRRCAGAGEETRAGHRGERNGDLELRVVVTAGALEGVGPALIEDIFALGVPFGVAGRDAEDVALGSLGDQVLRLPAGPRADRFRLFKRRQEGVRYKWVIDLSSC